MKKVGWLLVCVMLVLAVAVPVHANDTLPENLENQGLTTITDDPDPSDPQPSTETSQPPHEHSWGEGVITTEATCTAPGVRTYTCSCSETKTEEIAASGHSWGSWNNTSEKHSRVCSVCAAQEEGGHSYGNWQDKGTEHSKICTVCSHTVTNAHRWSSSTVLKKPTCKEPGILGNVCSDCSAVQEEEIAKLKVHTYDSACDSECNVCGIKRDVEHDFEAVWVKDSTGHWYACTMCDEKVAFAKHNPGPDATEEKEQVCTTCKYVIKPKKAHTHSFEKKWTTDEAGHWHACKSCDAEDAYAAHVYDDACDSDCNICDYEKDTGHTYDSQWKNTKWEHWQICTVCQKESKHEKHIPGPEATEKEAQLCTVCGFELAPVQIHTHDCSRNWEWETVNHWQICSCGEQSVAMEHSWDEGSEIRKDILEFRCTQCDATKMERKESGFPWMILLVILALGCVGGIAVLVVMLKRGEFDEAETDDQADVMTEDYEENPAEEIPLDLSEPEEDKDEIDMIDAFFASLDQE